MLIDTHCHINIMVKPTFDTLLQKNDFEKVSNIVDEAKKNGVAKIINVGTSLIESKNCVALATKFPNIYAAIGIHPTDLTPEWQKDLKEISNIIKNKETNKIVAIGECGIDKYHTPFDLQRQKDGFRAQIELALTNDLAIIVHSRNAPEETLYSLEEFKKDIKRCVIHCFSQDMEFAKIATSWGFYLGIGGTISYPKNIELREIISALGLAKIVLETDAPFLPPQIIRGKENHPKYIYDIAKFISELVGKNFEDVAKQTTDNSKKLFNID